MDNFKKAYDLLKAWKGDSYVCGLGCLDKVGEIAKGYAGDDGKVLVVSNMTYMKPVADRVLASLEAAGVEVAGGAVCPDAKPNAPREDVYRITTYVLQHRPSAIIAIGGGSTIDACKAASVLATLGGKVTPEIDYYFGTGKITAELEKTASVLVPVVAVETSASSGAHLTKYSNITDPVVGQKKLIVDPAVVPAKSIFDYEVTCSMPVRVTIDGALDAIAHTFEVFCGAKGDKYEEAKDLCETAVSLVVDWAGKIIENPKNTKAREAIGLATDLGGYAI
ncbi:MAG: iron-containing alcohol dehydrogenase, partial [Candidatus Ornithospirochaeta sp.]